MAYCATTTKCFAKEIHGKNCVENMDAWLRHEHYHGDISFDDAVIVNVDVITKKAYPHHNKPSVDGAIGLRGNAILLVEAKLDVSRFTLNDKKDIENKIKSSRDLLNVSPDYRVQSSTIVLVDDKVFQQRRRERGNLFPIRGKGQMINPITIGDFKTKFFTK